MTNLQNYLSKAPMFFSEEEQTRLFEEYHRTKDVNLRNAIVEKNLGLAVNVASQFKNPSLEFDDMVQIATIGLVQAVEHFDAFRGVKFSTFATTSIKNHLINAVTRDVSDISVVSIDEPVIFYSSDQKTGLTLAEFLEDESESHIARDLETQNILQRIYDWVLANCDAKEIVIFEASIGLHGKPQTGEKMAQALGVSTQRVYEIRKNLRRRLRNVFYSDLDFIQEKVY